MACKLSLNWVWAHFESASCVRVVLNRNLASRSLLDSSALLALDFDDALYVAEFVDGACEGFVTLFDDEDLLVVGGAGVPADGEAFVESAQNIG